MVRVWSHALNFFGICSFEGNNHPENCRTLFQKTEVVFPYKWLPWNCNLVVSRTLYLGTATATLIETILYFSEITSDGVCRSREGISMEQISTRMTAMLLACSFTQATFIQTTHFWSPQFMRLWPHWNLCQDWNNIRLLADMASGQEHGDRLWRMAALSRWDFLHKGLFLLSFFFVTAGYDCVIMISYICEGGDALQINLLLQMTDLNVFPDYVTK